MSPWLLVPAFVAGLALGAAFGPGYREKCQFPVDTRQIMREMASGMMDQDPDGRLTEPPSMSAEVVIGRLVNQIEKDCRP